MVGGEAGVVGELGDAGDGAEALELGVVADGEDHDAENHHQAHLDQALANLEGQGPAAEPLEEQEDQMPAVEHRDRQQIEHSQAEAHNSEKCQKMNPAVAGRFAGGIGNGDRPAQVLDRRLADQHPAQHPEHQYRQVPGALGRRTQRVQRAVTDLGAVAGIELGIDLNAGPDATDGAVVGEDVGFAALRRAPGLDPRDVGGHELQPVRGDAEQVRLELTAEERAALTSSRSVDPRAYDAYLRGTAAMMAEACCRRSIAFAISGAYARCEIRASMTSTPALSANLSSSRTRLPMMSEPFGTRASTTRPWRPPASTCCRRTCCTCPASAAAAD